MPKHEQSVTLTNMDADTALAISHKAFKDLNWSILAAGEEKLLAQTPKKWNTNQQVMVTANGSELMVSSEMIRDELADISGKNKKNVAAFINAFEAAKSGMQNDTLEANKQALQELRAATEISVAEEIKEAQEIDKAMNLSGSNLYVTYAIMAINILVFILMAVNGAGIIEPNSHVHIKWGSNYGPLTLTGDWWRLITSVFIHFGVIHLLMNMYCLYIVGIYLEPMLGKAKYTVAYLCTGVLASLVSLWWHKEAVNSAGASGAVFGLYGLFLALLSTKLIPKKVRDAQLKSIGIFVVYNLIYGMKGGVDNAAHIGGLVSGFVIGYLYAINIIKERREQKAAWVLPLVLVITVASTVGYLSNNTRTEADRSAALSNVGAARYEDSEKFNEKFNEMVALQDQAIAVFNEDLADDLLEKKLTEVSLPLWNKAEAIARQMQKMNVSEDMHKKADAVAEYVALRKIEIKAITNLVVNQSPTAGAELDSARNKMNAILEKMK